MQLALECVYLLANHDFNYGCSTQVSEEGSYEFDKSLLARFDTEILKSEHEDCPIHKPEL